MLDLATFAIPARLPAEPTAGMAGFAKRIAVAEAYVVVAPECNRSFPASLKQAIDCAYEEWRAEPVGFVSCGYRAGGRYAVEHLRDVFTELHTATVRDSVSLDLLGHECGDPGAGPHGESAGHADQRGSTDSGLFGDRGEDAVAGGGARELRTQGRGGVGPPDQRRSHVRFLPFSASLSRDSPRRRVLSPAATGRSRRSRRSLPMRAILSGGSDNSRDPSPGRVTGVHSGPVLVTG